ncbi:MAG: isoprenylcysteine carboxylmethyltransferase family protein [Anaerolineae bacterium]|nr:isoprenylcysteine carboxylmethyltransferase family protein [Anaerolineae bacterium]
MSTQSPINKDEKIKINPKSAIGMILFSALIPLIPLLVSWDWNWLQAWVFFILYTLSVITSRIVVLFIHPELLVERAAAADKENVKSWDKPLVFFMVFVFPSIGLLVAGLDRRFGWSTPPAVGWQWLAGVILALSLMFSIWAMAENSYFSAYVRIQHERGHRVISSGPYRLVRHPGYAGGIVSNLALPILLGSLWAFIPSLITIIFTVVRTSLEDRTLIQELAGYAEYTRKTHYRLFPGIW